MKKLITALLLTASVTAHADDLYLYTGAVTHHPDGFDEDVTNESHNLLAVEYNSYMAGVYDNSFGDTTVFAAYRFTRHFTPNIEGSLQVGVNFGYKGSCFKSARAAQSEMIQFCPEFTAAVTYTKFVVEPWVGLRGPIAMAGVRWDIDLE